MRDLLGQLRVEARAQQPLPAPADHVCHCPAGARLLSTLQVHISLAHPHEPFLLAPVEGSGPSHLVLGLGVGPEQPAKCPVWWAAGPWPSGSFSRRPWRRSGLPWPLASRATRAARIAYRSSCPSPECRGLAPSLSRRGHGGGALTLMGCRTRADGLRSRSRDVLDWRFAALGTRVVVTAALIVNSCGDAPRDNGRERRSSLSAGARTAGERRGDVVQRSQEVYFLLASESVELRP